MSKIIIGQSAARNEDKVFEMTIFDPSNGKVWNDGFASIGQTEAAALESATRFFPDCGIVPARLTRTRGWFLYGAAVGFAVACVLLAIVLFIFLPKLI